MQLILARHGNTFNPGDKVVYVGASNDLPLVEKGREQALKVASALKQQNTLPTAIFCAPLLRTKEYAQIIAEQLRLPQPPIVEPTLTEIDYGDWAGLTADEVKLRFGQESLNAWNEKSIWPTNANWTGSAAQLVKTLTSFADKITKAFTADDTLLFVSSNGVLRYFLELIPTAFQKSVREKQFTMKTGHLSQLTYDNQQFSLAYWNKDPATF